MFRKLKVSDRVQAWRQVPLFSACTNVELKELSSLSSEVEVAEGTVMCRAGERGRSFYVLIDGTAKVTRPGRRTVPFGPGDFFGELALLDDGPRTATVTMTSAGRVLELTSTEFRGLLRAVPGIAVRMLPVLGARLRAVDSEVS